jgi:RsiW-degrading membrane proteinase PrsW (M82 family)
MFCAHCGTQCLPEHKFCKGCGAAIGAPGSTLDAPPASAAPLLSTVPMVAAAPPAPPPPPIYTAAMVPPPPPYPGAPPGVYPGVPQPVYYVNAQQHARHQMNVLQSLKDRIQSMASTETLEGFSLTQMFSDVFKRRGGEVVEEYVLCGSTRATPPIELVETGWPKPWLFFRMLAALAIAYIALVLMWNETANPNTVPGIMFLGSFAFPVATLCLFFELNTPRNVSIHAIGKLFLAGAVVSLGVALLGYALPIFQLATMEAGIVEEVAKFAAVLIVMHSVRYKYILNGLLFGATVGAGFAAFETMGYALNVGLLNGYLNIVSQAGSLAPQVQTTAMSTGVSQMISLLLLRGIEAPLGHVAWTALSAGAFWRVKQGRPFSPSMLVNPHFLKAFAIPVVMHATWDAPWQLPFSGNQIITGLITWYVVFGLVQQGLRQVKEEQMTHLQGTLDRVQAQLQPPGTVAV